MMNQLLQKVLIGQQNMNKLKLTKEEARNCIWSDSPEGYKVVYNEQYGSGRWESYHQLVIYDLKNKRYYSDTYSMGLTESQENNCWDDREPNFTEVFPHKVMTTVYKSKPQDEV